MPAATLDPMSDSTKHPQGAPPLRSDHRDQGPRQGQVRHDPDGADRDHRGRGRRFEGIELSDQQVLDVVIREAKKRREAEEAYANAGRTELAEKEHAESDVLADYLPHS